MDTENPHLRYAALCCVFNARGLRQDDAGVHWSTRSLAEAGDTLRRLKDEGFLRPGNHSHFEKRTLTLPHGAFIANYPARFLNEQPLAFLPALAQTLAGPQAARQVRTALFNLQSVSSPAILLDPLYGERAVRQGHAFARAAGAELRGSGVTALLSAPEIETAVARQFGLQWDLGLRPG